MDKQTKNERLQEIKTVLKDYKKRMHQLNKEKEELKGEKIDPRGSFGECERCGESKSKEYMVKLENQTNFLCSGCYQDLKFLLDYCDAVPILKDNGRLIKGKYIRRDLIEGKIRGINDHLQFEKTELAKKKCLELINDLERGKYA